MPLLGPDGNPIEPTVAAAAPRVVQPSTVDGDPVTAEALREVHHEEPADAGQPIDGHARLWEGAQRGDPVAAALWVIADGLHPDSIPRDGMCMCAAAATRVLRNAGEHGVTIAMPDRTLVDLTVDRNALESEIVLHSVLGIPGPEDNHLTAATRLLAHYRAQTPEDAARNEAFEKHMQWQAEQVRLSQEAGAFTELAEDRAIAFGTDEATIDHMTLHGYGPDANGMGTMEKVEPVERPDGSIDI